MAFVKPLGKEYTTNAISDDSQFTYVSNDISDFVVCKSPDKLKTVLESLKPGKMVEFVTNGDWSLIDMVIELLKKYKPANIYIATYAIREFPIRQLILAQERGELKEINILLESRAKIRTPDVYHFASMNANKIFLTPLHAKATVIESPAGCVTITGSQNYTANPRLENGMISLCEKRARFNINWIKNVMEHAEIFD